MRADVDGVLDELAIFLFVEFDLGGKIKIMRRGICRINAKNEKGLDLPVVDVTAQFAQRFEIVHRVRFHRFGVVQRLTDIVEGRIDFVHQCMERSGLVLTCDNQALALIFKKIFRNGIEEFLAPRWRSSARKGRSSEPNGNINDFLR